MWSSLWLVVALGAAPQSAGPAVSPLQARVDAAAPGAIVDVGPGKYSGDLVIRTSVRLIGHGRPVLEGSGAGTVVEITAPDVTIEGFDIDGRGGGSLAHDSSGIHISAARVTVRDCRIGRSLFGIYLLEANDARIEHNVVRGAAGKDPGDQGSGIHLFNSSGFSILDNDVRDSRDGIYLQASPRGFIARNHVSDVRYGLHYMFSDDNTFEDNVFERSAAGAALMYSKRIVFRRNQFRRNRGFASAGLLLQACDDVTAEDNLIDDNARGVFLESTHRNIFRRNLIALSDSALVIYDSAESSRFEGNAFVGNLSPLLLVGRRTDAVVDRNYWSEADDVDLDGDGVLDRPYRLSNVFDHLRGNLTAADLFAQGLGAAVLGAAERSFPVLAQTSVQDAHPLARMPVLSAVPVRSREDNARGISGVVMSTAAIACGSFVLWSGRRRSAPGGRA